MPRVIKVIREKWTSKALTPMEIGMVRLIEKGLENGPPEPVPRATKRSAATSCSAGEGRVFCAQDRVGVQGIGEAHIHEFLTRFGLRTREGCRELAWRRVKTSVHRLLTGHGWSVRTKERKKDPGVWDLSFQLKAPGVPGGYNFAEMTRDEIEDAVKLAYCRVYERGKEQEAPAAVPALHGGVGIAEEPHIPGRLAEVGRLAAEVVDESDEENDLLEEEAVPESDDDEGPGDWDLSLFPSQNYQYEYPSEFHVGASLIVFAGPTQTSALSRASSSLSYNNLFLN